MRRWRVVLITVLGWVLALGATTAVSVEEDAPDPFAQREEVVALVLAQDERFAGLPDYERQAVLASANFDTVGMLLSEDYYRVLPSQSSYFSPWWVDFGYPSSWLVEVNLVDGCVEPSSDDPPIPDPCEWRHSWLYRVQPDGSVALLYEEGDPDPLSAE